MYFQYDKTGCRHLFKTYPHNVDEIKAAIEQQVRQQAETDFSKTKLASRLPYEGQKVYECRVNVGKLPAVRVAFTFKGEAAYIAFASTDIQKSTFSEAVGRFLSKAVKR